VELDWLRVIALGLLIVYHVFCLYSGDWRMSSAHAGSWGLLATAVLYPWRMALVFLIGGIAARYLIERAGAAGFVADRFKRLIVPFAFAVIVLIPIQDYVRLDEIGRPQPFYPIWLITDGFRIRPFHHVMLPDVAHAWFLPYLFTYCAAVAVAWRWLRPLLDRLQALVEDVPIWLVFAGVAALFAFEATVIAPWKPQDGFVVTDIDAHVHFAPIFLLGFLTGRSKRFAERLAMQATPFALLAAAIMPVSLTLLALHIRPGAPIDIISVRQAEALYGAAMLFAVLGLAQRSLKAAGPALGVASDAIMPIYLLHQTVLVVVADNVARLHLPLTAEFPLVVGATVLGPLAAYFLVIKRSRTLRFLFGMRFAPKTAARPAGSPPGVEPLART